MSRPKRVVLIGSIIGPNTILEEVESRHNNRHFKVLCNLCGTEKIDSLSNIVRRKAAHCFCKLPSRNKPQRVVKHITTVPADLLACWS